MINGSTAANPANIELSPMRVSWNGTDLGATSGNCTVTIKTEKGDIVADQSGKSLLDKRINGMNIQVHTELLEARSVATWAKVFPSATASGTSSLTFQLPMGSSDRANAQILNLHPLVKADSDLTQDHNFYLAYPSEQSEIVYGPSGESKLKLVWNVYPVITGGATSSWKWYKFGDLSTGP